jgi:DHA3 family macrolide efflux protein-like MFS transporter
MLMLKALRHPPIKRLWFGQALSSIGDEIYRVGLTWLAVGLIGADTGYLTAGQSATLMILSFVGGKWADHWDPLRTMIRVDLIRALIVLIPVVYSYFAPVPLSLLIVVALILSGLGAFFDPAMQTVLPSFSPDRQTLQAATGLMMTTTRLARMIGPAIVGFLAGIVPPIHFFTMDALSFFISASSVQPLQTQRPTKLRERRRISFGEAIFSGFKSLRQHRGMSFVLFSKAMTTGTWNLVYGLGFALLVQELAPHDTRSFGFVIASYGIGNFAGALYFGNIARVRPALMMFIGFVWLGFGFLLISRAPTIPWIMVTAAFTGFSGTMNEVTFSDMVQARFPLGEITKIFRLRMATDTAMTLVLMLLSPLMFRLLSVRTVIATAGVVWILIGTAGLIWFQESKPRGALSL